MPPFASDGRDLIGRHGKPGGKPFAGSVALQTPFGTLVGPNITPDPEAGIGSWTDDNFVSALRHGKFSDEYDLVIEKAGAFYNASWITNGKGSAGGVGMDVKDGLAIGWRRVAD